jgi:hypothetical protein
VATGAAFDQDFVVAVDVGFASDLGFAEDAEAEVVYFGVS